MLGGGGGGALNNRESGNELLATCDTPASAPDSHPHFTLLVSLSPGTTEKEGTNTLELSDTYDTFLVGDKVSPVPLCFFHADKRLFNSFVLIISDCRLFTEELDRGDRAGERGLDGVNRLSMLYPKLTCRRKRPADSLGEK